jgi:hypothetical protein
MAQPTNAGFAIALGAASCLLMALALPQVNVAWLTVPRDLDHTHPETLNAQQRASYTAALNVIPQSQTLYALAEADLREPNLTTLKRESAINMLEQAAAQTPGNTHIWYLLAAAVETEMFDAGRRALWDHAMSMSLLTGPFARDLLPLRTTQMVQHWDIASPDLKNLWQVQTINLWGADPDEIYRIYTAQPPEGQKIFLDTLGEAPAPEAAQTKD